MKIVSLVDSQSTWAPATNARKDKIENPSLVLQEQIKNRKHAEFYAPIWLCFLCVCGLLLWFLLVLQQFIVYLPFLISNYAKTISSSFARIFHLCWIFPLVRSFVPSAIGKIQLSLELQLPRSLLCASSEFLVFRCHRLCLAQSWLGTALARQTPSPLLSLSPMLPPSPLTFLQHFLLHPSPLPLILPRKFPLSLDALPIPSLSSAWPSSN